MGLLQSRQTQPSTAAPPTISSSTPPRPSASRLAPPSTILSYFLPLSTPDLTHHHIPPSIDDIHLVATYLAAKGLPGELAWRILDQAQYWTGCRVQSKKNVTVHATDHRGHARGGHPWLTGQEDEMDQRAFGEDGGLRNGRGQVWYLASAPLGCVCTNDTEDRGDGEVAAEAERSGRQQGQVQRVWIREVVVETLSHDQGWSNEARHYAGTYEQSYSWFEIALLRDGEEVEGSRHSIQHNVHAGQYFKAHSNTLGLDHPTVRLARPGDRVVLWVRAQYPGWSNWVQEAAITVFVTPFPPQI